VIGHAHRRIAALTAVALTAVAMCAAVGGCGGDGGAGGPAPPVTAATSTTSTTSTTSVSTAAITPTVTASTPTSTVAPTPAVFPSPRAAADLLFSAWISGDRAVADASHWAPAPELDKLFGAAVIATPRNRGCDDGLGGMSQCFVANGNGGIDIDLVAASGGWTVQTITPFAGG